MVTRDYYLVLGVARTAPSQEIRRAYRRQALERHPDHAGPEQTAEFQQLSDAYHVLADPRRRAAYDAELRQAEATPRFGPVTDLRRRPIRATEAEPLVPSRLASSLFRDFRAPYDVVEDTFSQLFRSFTGWGVPKSGWVEPIDIDVGLTREEAARDAVLEVGVPRFVVCPACEGTGADGWYPCRACDQTGVLEREVRVPLRIPASVPDGAVLETFVSRPGGPAAVIRARIRVSG
jgi:DnaJ-class molecular chaperone